MASKSHIKKKLLELYRERDIQVHTKEHNETRETEVQAQIDILIWVLSNKKGDLNI